MWSTRGPEKSRIASGNHTRVPSLFVRVSPCDGSVVRTQLSCQIVSPSSISGIDVADRAILDKILQHVSLPFSCVQSLAALDACNSNEIVFSICRLCNSALLFSVSALAPDAVAIKVFFVVRKENLLSSSFAPLMLKNDNGSLFDWCFSMSARSWSPLADLIASGCSALFGLCLRTVSKYTLSGMSLTF